jgi:thiol-disulfide isomerase/thioredoxin/Flp pilus assembly protein TadD
MKCITRTAAAGVLLLTSAAALWSHGTIASGGTAQPPSVVATQHTPTPAARAALEQAKSLAQEKQTDAALAAFYKAVEADPDDLAAHDWLISFRTAYKLELLKEKKPDLIPRLKAMNESIDARYQEWERRFPNSIGIVYGQALHLSDRESPRAKPYLLKLVAHDWKDPKIYSMLAADAFMAGDAKEAAEYLHKAALLDPDNAERAYAYARAVEPSQRQAAILDVIKRFPATATAATALYWLGEDSHADSQRIAYFEQLRAQFPPDKFSWSEEGMPRLFESYLRAEPVKAMKFAAEMQAAHPSKDWEGRVQLARTFVEVQKKLAAGKANDALALLDHLNPEHRSDNTALIERLKARVMAGAGQARSGYDALLKLQASAPDEETLATLMSIGKQLHRTAAQVQADIKAGIDAGARPAPAFNLQQYTSDEEISLAKLHGKVVLLTFWFPGCGPCAREFPHFEAVMEQFHHSKDVAYIGINVVRDQDSYVLPLVERKKYTFTPLKGTDEVTGAEHGFNAKGAPTNFIIDRDGRIVYHGFMIDDPHGELMVQRMIESVL